MDAIIRHTGISALTLVGASALTAAMFLNPVGAVMFASGFVWWIHDRTRG